MAGEEYIQVGVTALRDPVTHDYLPAVPLYIKAENGAEDSERGLIQNIGKLFAERMGMYFENCKEV